MDKLISYIASLAKGLIEAFLPIVKVSLTIVIIIVFIALSGGGPEAIEVFKAFSKINVTNQANNQLFPLIHRHKENKAIQRSLKISFRELLTKLQYYGSIN